MTLKCPDVGQALSMPGLVANDATTSPTIAVGSARVHRRSASPVSGPVRGGMPSDHREIQGVVAVESTTTTVPAEMSSSSPATYRSTRVDKRYPNEGLISAYSTDSDDLDDSASSYDRHSENSMGGSEDAFSLTDSHVGDGAAVRDEQEADTFRGVDENDNCDSQVLYQKCLTKNDCFISDCAGQLTGCNQRDKRSVDTVLTNCEFIHVNSPSPIVKAPNSVPQKTKCKNERSDQLYLRKENVSQEKPMHKKDGETKCRIGCNQITKQKLDTCKVSDTNGSLASTVPTASDNEVVCDGSKPLTPADQPPPPQDACSATGSDTGAISNQRQRSLGPEPSQSVSKSKPTKHLLRSKSYPLVAERILFTPIRPSPEQSGLFPVHHNVGAPTQTSAALTEGADGGHSHSDNAPSTQQDTTAKKSQTKPQPSNPPVARVNPQANPSAALLQQEHLKSQQQQQAYCQPMYAPVNPNFYSHDNSVFYQQGTYPVLYVQTSGGNYYMQQDIYTSAMQQMEQQLVPQQTTKLQPLTQARPSSEYVNSAFKNNNEKSSRGVSQSKHNDMKTVNDKSVSTSVPAVIVKANNGPDPSLSTKLNKEDSGHPHPGSSDHPSQPRRKHKQPLLPDPLIPKFSELANMNLGVNSAHPSESQPNQYQHSQQQQQHPYYIQPYSNSAPVFQVNPVFLQQVPPNTTSNPGLCVSTPPPSQPSRGQGQSGKASSGSQRHANNAYANGDTNAPTSSPAAVGYVTDHTGLVIYGPQPPLHPPAQSLPPSHLASHSHHQGALSPPTLNMGRPPSGADCNQGQQQVEDGHSNQHGKPQEGSSYHAQHHDCHGGHGQHQTGPNQQLDVQIQQEAHDGQTHQVPVSGPGHSGPPPFAGGIIYIPDGTGNYIAVDAATVHAQMEAVAYQNVYPQGTPGGYVVAGTLVPMTGEVTQEVQASVNMDNSPATVRMVSSGGPPVPMPMQVPPGHMVQQIVDEHGILTHVILSPQPPGPAAPMTVGPYGGPASGSQYYTSYGAPHYPPSPAQYSHHPHPHPVPSHVHGGMPHIPSPTPPNCTNHVPVQSQGEYGASPPLNSTDDRTLRTRNRVRKKLQQRRINSNDGFYPTPPRPIGRRNRGVMGVNGDVGMHDPGLIHGHCMTSENGPMDMEEENNLITQCLSTMPAPKVTDVEARSSLIQLSPPEIDSTELDLDPSDLKYELLLSDKGREAKYKTVFCGDATEITLKDLKPATEYHLKVCAVFGEELKGALTEPVSFQTLNCEPDAPQAPKLMNKTKTSVQLKWNAACENGSKVTAYQLEYDKGDGNFREAYSGLQRQHRVNHLNASTRYVFRLAAINTLGKSPYSEVVSFFTSGSVPSQPDPPMLSEQFVFALTISWIRRPNDDEFLLQMEDESTGHGFIPVYNGPNLSYTVAKLRRNTEYKFRLAAKNEEGPSKWSETVCYKTLPERPQPPSKPQIKGKINPYSFRITWDPPSDSGGTEISKYIVELDDGQGYDTVYEGSEREHIFDHLRPGHLYRVRVASCSLGGRSDFSECCVATTLPVAPGQCQAPKLQGKPKATSLHLRWGYPDYDGGSQVTSFAAQMISPDNTTREVYKGHDRDCIVAGLLPGRPYLFQVRAFNRAGAGPWSEPLEVISGAGVPDAPRAPHVLCRSAHTALVSWEEPCNNGASIGEYRLEWQQRTDTAEFSQLYVGPNLSFDAKGLTPATMYTFRVQAINSAGPSQFSPSTPYVTPPSSPSPVIYIKVQANATSALLTWREPNSNGGDITSYNIDVSDKPLISVDPVTEYLLEDLSPETNYKIRVQAVNGIGVGAFSQIVKCTTKALPPSPPRLECVMLAPTSIKLKWGEGRNSDLLTYTLEMEKEDGSFQPVYTGPAHTHKVTRLTELTSYEFRIYASNDAGSGPYSDTYSFTTTKSPPPPIKAPRVHSLTVSGCVLEWQGVKPLGGDAVAYVLQLLSLNGRETEYKQLYKGPNTQYQLDCLQPNTEYQARVAAVRLSSDNTGDIIGAYSPGVIISPLAPEPLHTSSNVSASGAGHQKEKRGWSFYQIKIFVFICFVLLVFLAVEVCLQFISFDDKDLSTSALPSSSSHTSGGRRS